METIARGPDVWIELGPGKVLCGLLKRIDRQQESMSAGTPARSNSWWRPSMPELDGGSRSSRALPAESEGDRGSSLPADAGSRVWRGTRRGARVAGLPRGGTGIRCDVADPEECVALVSAVEADWDRWHPGEQRGITRDNVFVRLRDEDWDSVLGTNLRGREHDPGGGPGDDETARRTIVNIASVVGLTGNRGQANYAASKAGLMGFPSRLRRSWVPRRAGKRRGAGVHRHGHDVRAPAGGEGRHVRAHPAGPIRSPEDVAGVVRFLAGPAAAYMTGQVLVVDGGMVMHG